jgi:hypothetical protein
MVGKRSDGTADSLRGGECGEWGFLVLGFFSGSGSGKGAFELGDRLAFLRHRGCHGYCGCGAA